MSHLRGESEKPVEVSPIYRLAYNKKLQPRVTLEGNF